MTEPSSARHSGAQPSFQIEAESHSSGAVVRLLGSCSMDCAAELTDRLVKLATEPHPVIVLDLSQLEFIESSGLGGIVAAHLKCRRRNAELRIAAPQPAILRILKLTRLTDLFRVFDSAEAALQHQK